MSDLLLFPVKNTRRTERARRITMSPTKANITGFSSVLQLALRQTGFDTVNE